MRKLIVFTLVATGSLLVACNRNEPGKAPAESAPAAQAGQGPQTPVAGAATAPPPPAPVGPSEPPAPPAPIVEGMYVIYACDDGTEPRITFSGNLVKVELTADSAPVVLSARASATNMSDTYSGDALTLHRDGLGVTLDQGGGKTTRCSEREASA